MEVRTLKELVSAARTLVDTLAPREDGATLVTLSGELGAGKTAFTQALAAALGVNDPVTSPTFVLEKVYQLEGQKFSRLVHIDAYRLTGGEELTPLGFDEVMRDSATLVVLEWPERVADKLPKAAVAATLVAHPDGSRTISYA